MPVSTLARLNNMNADDTLVKGQRLVIKASSRRYRDEGADSGRRLLYTVRSGDTVYSISKQFQVSVHAAQELERAERASPDQSRATARHVRGSEPAARIGGIWAF